MKNFKLNLTQAVMLGAAVAAALSAGSARALSVASDTNPFTSGATVLDFNAYDGLLTTGPLDMGTTPGAVVFTSAPFAVVGAAAQDLGANGLWGARGTPEDGLVDTPTGNGHFLASAFVARRGELGFSFAQPVAKVGAFFNQFQTDGVPNNLRLIAYDAAGNELESFAFSINTAADGYNEGKFLGFSRTSADIYGFGISDGSFVMDNLTTAPVPEPGTYALMAAGLLVVGRLASRRLRT